MLTTTNSAHSLRFARETSRTPTTSDNVADWAKQARAAALEKAQANISPPDGQPGAVLASPSRQDPNYYYHWVRDGARTMRAFVHLYDVCDAEAKASVRESLFEMLERYVTFSKLNQTTPTLTRGPGEPKFYVTGQAFDGPWGRPQNDAPAQRALVLTRWAKHLLGEGHERYVRGVLYDGGWPDSFSVIKTDLEFVAHNWQAPCFDLWEELHGTHFFTRMQQRVALAEGASLARTLGDGGAADFYAEQAAAIEAAMDAFWNPDANYLVSTLPAPGGFKPENLDTAVLIASAETFSTEAPFYTPDHDRVLATAFALHQRFASLYRINEVTRTSAGEPIFPGIGRYPGDTYTGGAERGEGNPWFLCTLALAEVCYKAARQLRNRSSIAINPQNEGFFNLAVQLVSPDTRLEAGTTLNAGSQESPLLTSGLIAAGDAYLRRVRLHAAQDGSLSEQFNRETGLMMSARDLTWSYVAMVLAENWRSLVT